MNGVISPSVFVAWNAFSVSICLAYSALYIVHSPLENIGDRVESAGRIPIICVIASYV